jgi:hypothetical protein
MRTRSVLCVCFVLLASGPAARAAGDAGGGRVDLRLVLAIDVGGPDDVNQTIQRQGYVAAFRSPDVLAAIKSGP